MQAMRFSSGLTVVLVAAVWKACCRRMAHFYGSTVSQRERWERMGEERWMTGRKKASHQMVPHKKHANRILKLKVHTLQSRTTTAGTTLPTLSGSNNPPALGSAQRVAHLLQPTRRRSRNNLLVSGRTLLRLSVCSTRKSTLLVKVMLASMFPVSTLVVKYRDLC